MAVIVSPHPDSRLPLSLPPWLIAVLARSPCSRYSLSLFTPRSGSSVELDLGACDLPLLVRAGDVRARLGFFVFCSGGNQGSIESCYSHVEWVSSRWDITLLIAVSMTSFHITAFLCTFSRRKSFFLSSQGHYKKLLVFAFCLKKERIFLT